MSLSLGGNSPGGLSPPQFHFVSAKGVSGVIYDLQAYPFGAVFHELPGLYAFCYRISEADWCAVYVGQTHNLQSRVGTGLVLHHKFMASQRLGATHVAVRVFSGPETARLDAERDLIAGVQPCLNETYNALARVGLGRVG